MANLVSKSLFKDSYGPIFNAVQAANGGSPPTSSQLIKLHYILAAETLKDPTPEGIAAATEEIVQKINLYGASNVKLQGTGVAGSQSTSADNSAWAKSRTQVLCGIDPLCQNFFVDANFYPRGIFVSSVELYFATKDDSIPVSVRIRPTVNGYPDSSNDVPGSIVYKNPADINVPDPANITKSIGLPTKFVFDHPIYLPPGQHTIMLASNSNKYYMYCSKVGQVEFGTNVLLNQLNYTGSLFKSQNASTWVAAPGETLCFNLYNCNFAAGTATFDIRSKLENSPIYYDLMKLTTQELTFGSYDKISYEVLTTNADTATQNPATSIIANQNVNFSTRSIVNGEGDLIIRPTLENYDTFTSPVLDLERLNTILVKNIVSSYETANTVAESLGGLGNGGGAVARYITRRVTLNNNFDATGLTVFLDVNRPPGTKIEVYYKVLNKNDINNFDRNGYVLMNPKFTVGGTLESTGPDSWVSDTYQALDITYNDIKTNVTYNDFNVFAIKVVFYSSNPSIVPRIKNFRAIATA